MGRYNQFGLYFEINRSLFTENIMRDKRLLHFRSKWPSDIRFSPLVTLVERYVSAKLEISTENRKHGMDGKTDGRTNGRTDRRTDERGATHHAAPREGSVIKSTSRCSEPAMYTVVQYFKTNGPQNRGSLIVWQVHNYLYSVHCITHTEASE